MKLTYRILEKKITAKIIKKVVVEELGECWEWQGASLKEGYGCFVITDDMFGIPKKNYTTHRLMAMIHLGLNILDKKQVVCHECDNPPCVNPDHLFTGTHEDNMQDSKNKGRTSHSDETKIKISKTVKEKYNDPSYIFEKRLQRKFKNVEKDMEKFLNGAVVQ